MFLQTFQRVLIHINYISEDVDKEGSRLFLIVYLFIVHSVYWLIQRAYILCRCCLKVPF